MDSTRSAGPPDLSALKAVAERIGRESGFRLIALFGSAARGEPRPADLDFAVLGDGTTDVVALTNRLTQALGVQEIDVTDLRRADPLLMAFVARDGIALYERSPGELDRFASLAYRRFADTRKFREAEHADLRERLARLESGA